MKQVTATGNSIEKAVESALAQLNVRRDQVDVEVIDEGSKGIFGLIGSREAIVKVKINQDSIEELMKYYRAIAFKMGVSLSVDFEIEGKQLLMSFSGNNMALFIGKRGQTLYAFQVIGQAFLQRKSSNSFQLILDAENYRKKRAESLVILAHRMADKSRKTKRPVALDPMLAFERKIIHEALADDVTVETSSSGEEPNRYVLIKPKR